MRRTTVRLYESIDYTSDIWAHLNYELCIMHLALFFQPTSVFNPHMQPDTGDGINCVGEYHFVVEVEISAPFCVLREIIEILVSGKRFWHQETREQI